MKKINIGLSVPIDQDGAVSAREGYIKSVWNENAIPSLLIPDSSNEYIRDVTDTFDGFIFCGGGDIDPRYYREEKSTDIKNVCFKRDEFEAALFSSVYAQGKPILGICRGMQIINVFLGGSLFQHIEGHLQASERQEKSHAVNISDGTLLKKIICSDMISVNSFHHQAVKKLADRLTVDAVSHDGRIEAYHEEGHNFLLCVQWHPEAYYDLDESSNRIFRAFIAACKEDQAMQ